MMTPACALHALLQRIVVCQPVLIVMRLFICTVYTLLSDYPVLQGTGS
ncbi:MAG: hypothetical protein R3E36_12075 [Nitrosomonas sp.]|nr:hypothetical protein [Nitrosomonas sp.]